MIQGVYMLHDPNATEKGSPKIPVDRLIASFELNITLYILYTALKLCLKGFECIGKLIVASVWWQNGSAWP